MAEKIPGYIVASFKVGVVLVRICCVALRPTVHSCSLPRPASRALLLADLVCCVVRCAQDLFTQADTNKDGSIDQKEMLVALAEHKNFARTVPV